MIAQTIFLAGDNFLPELHLRQPGFTSSVCRWFNKHLERIENFKEMSDLILFIKTNQANLIFLIILHILKPKIWLKELFWIIFWKKKLMKFTKSLKSHGCQRELVSMVYNVFEKKIIASECKWRFNSRIT